MTDQFSELTIGTRTAPLGLRFWDSLLSQTVSEGLEVTAWPQAAPSKRSTASVNKSRVFIFHHLPGMREVENGAGDEAFWSAPPKVRTFVIEVRDTRVPARFLPFRFETQVPVRREFSWTPPAGVAFADLPSGMLPLLSAPTRPVPAGIGVVRFRLWDPTAATPAGQTFAGRPAAWAVVTATVGALGDLRAVTDAQGHAALFIHYPAPAANLVTVPVSKQTWPVKLDALYTPTAAAPASSPLLVDLLGQAAASLWTTWDAAPANRTPLSNAPLVLEYGRELVVKSSAAAPPGVLFVTQP